MWGDAGEAEHLYARERAAGVIKVLHWSCPQRPQSSTCRSFIDQFIVYCVLHVYLYVFNVCIYKKSEETKIRSSSKTNGAFASRYRLWMIKANTCASPPCTQKPAIHG